MRKIEVDKITIKLPVLKLCCFYQMFDPNTAKFLNRNVYQFLGIVFTAFILCVIVLGQVGICTNKDEIPSDIDLLLLVISYISCSLSVIKFSVFLFKANKVWDLFDVARLDFMTSNMCHKNISILYNCRNWIIKTTNYLTIVILVICTQWIIIPLVANAMDDTVSSRKQTVVNFQFPVSIHTYNQYYDMFYLIEIMYILYATYSLIIFDIFIMSFCWVIMNLYQILTKSIADVGYANKPQSEHHEDFKTILSDQIELDLKLKLFYDIIRPFMLIYVSLSSCLIITLTCAFITICSSYGSYSAFQVFKLGSSAAYVYFEMFLFCSFLDLINTNRDSVNFGIYSSNWTMMDLKFKKLLLMAMQMNDANIVELKASPKKIVNLQLFSNVIKICYNVTSVMLKTMKNK